MEKNKRGWKYALFKKQAEEALKALTDMGKEAVLSGTLREWVEKNHAEDFKKLSKSWHVFLFKAQHDDSSPIALIPGTYTYRLSSAEPPGTPPVEESDEEAESELDDEGKKKKKLRVQREQLVYEPLRDWLSSWAYASKVTAETKSGGPWGNPDIAGIKLRSGLFMVTDVELATVEAKASLDNWKRYFFEAVSHKRFAHRSYFAALYSADTPTIEAVPVNLRQELREYGEKFAVGILLLLVTKKTFQALHTADAETIKTVKLDDLRVIELWPAQYQSVAHASVRAHLQDTLELGDEKAIKKFHDEALADFENE